MVHISRLPANFLAVKFRSLSLSPFPPRHFHRTFIIAEPTLVYLPLPFVPLRRRRRALSDSWTKKRGEKVLSFQVGELHSSNPPLFPSLLSRALLLLRGGGEGRRIFFPADNFFAFFSSCLLSWRRKKEDRPN